jgi:L-iditol 2-dehydrogenase
MPKRASIPAVHQIQWIEDASLERTPGEGEVALEPLAVGICGSDLHVFENEHPFVTLPVLPGHEVAGRITAIGPNVDVGWLGAMVALEPNVTCGQCKNCRRGRYNICEKLEVMGFQTPGAMGERFVTPVSRLHRLPANLEPEVGAMIEPLAVAVHAVRMVNVTGQDAAVLGAGTIGLLVAQVARAYGAASVRVIDLLESRRAIATQLGLESREPSEDKFDVILECVGSGRVLAGAIESCHKGGEIVVVGVYGQPATIPAKLIQDWELTLRGTLMYTSLDYVEAIRLLEHNLVNTKPLITHRFKLSEVEQGFHQALKRDVALKVMLLA